MNNFVSQMKNQNLNYFDWGIWPLFLKGNKNTTPGCSPESCWMTPFCAWWGAVAYHGRRNSDGDPNLWSSVELWSNWYQLLRHHTSSLPSQTCNFWGAHELQASQKRKLSKVSLSDQLQETPENSLISVLMGQPELQEEPDFKNEAVPSWM